MAAGEAFELPAFPTKPNGPTIAFCEGPDTLIRWKAISEQIGIAELLPVPGNKAAYVVHRILTADGGQLLETQWGRYLAPAPATPITGIWLRLSAPPVLAPWQAPITWTELGEACRELGVDIIRHFSAQAAR